MPWPALTRARQQYWCRTITDSGKPGAPAAIDLHISGLPAGRLLMQHYRVDDEFNNSFESWKKMGSPAKPSAEQYAQLERAGQCSCWSRPGGSCRKVVAWHVEFALPLHGVSLIRLTW